MKYSILFIAFSIPLAIYLLPMLGFEKIVYKLDVYSPFWIFSLQFGIGLMLFVKLFGDFKKWIIGIICETKVRSLLALLIITLVAIFISLAWIKGSSRVEADESIYLATAQNLYYNQIGIHCMEGEFLKYGLACVIFESVKGRGLSYVYMLGMPFFGTDLYWVYNFHTFLLLLTLPIFFLALKVWTKNDALSILSVALISSVPIMLFQFRSASMESAYIFYFVLSLLFLKWAYDRNTIRHWLLLALTLAFFAQTRSETVFCLFAFIWVAFYRICVYGCVSNKVQQNFWRRIRGYVTSGQIQKFSLFLATISFFSIPIISTLSNNRDNSLQGGSYSAFGHLFENIVENFKIMALTKTNYEGLLQVPFFPYFTWFALFGLIILIILTIKEYCLNQNFKELKDFQNFNNNSSQLNIKYAPISLFLLLLSPQYIILFDVISADFNLVVQQRFILIILPVLAFLGALFLVCLLRFLKDSNKFLNTTNTCIFIAGIITINTISYSTSFEQNIMYKNDYLTTEKNYLHSWLKKQPDRKKMLFHTSPILLFSHGYSSYSYVPILGQDSIAMQEILEEYNGEVYIIKGFYCKQYKIQQKMITPMYKSICEQLEKYIEYEELESNGLTTIYRIKGLTDVDKNGFFRLVNFFENTKDSLLILNFVLPKKDSVPWKLQRYVNNEFVHETPYEHSTSSDYYNISLLEKDTNIIDFKIIDTITGDTIHKDYLRLGRIR